MNTESRLLFTGPVPFIHVMTDNKSIPMTMKGNVIIMVTPRVCPKVLPGRLLTLNIKGTKNRPRTVNAIPPTVPVSGQKSKGNQSK